MSNLQRVVGIIGLCIFIVQVNATEPQEITIFYGSEDKGIGEILKQFTQATDINVSARIVDSVELKAELMQGAAAGSLPDAVLVSADFLGLPGFDYSAIPPSHLSEDTSISLKNTTLIEEEYLGVPVTGGNHLVMYYNKSLLPNPAATWAELAEQKSILGEETRLIAWTFDEMYWFIPFLTAFDSQPVTNNKATLDTSAMQQALAYYWGLAKQGLVDQNCDYQCAQTGFTEGQQAYLISGIWAYAELQLAMGNQLGIAILPTINTNKMRSYFTSHALAFPRQSLYGPKRKALLRLIDYMQSPQAQTQIWQYMKTLPVSQRVLDSIRETSDTNIHNLLQQFDQSVQMPSSFVMAIVWEAMLKGSRRYGAGILSAQQATLFMQHLAEKSIAYKNVQD